MRVIDLLPGDAVRNGPDSATYIAQAPHPLWPNLQLVVWLMGDGQLNLDALQPGQELLCVERSTPGDRQQRLRDALTGGGR